MKAIERGRDELNQSSLECWLVESWLRGREGRSGRGGAHVQVTSVLARMPGSTPVSTEGVTPTDHFELSPTHCS